MRHPANCIVRLRTNKRRSILIKQETFGGRNFTMTNDKRFNRSASQLMMAALALAIALISNMAFAQVQQEKGRRITPNRPDSAQSEAQAEQSASSAQDKLILIETQDTGYSNPILDTRTIRFDVSENAKRFIFDETPLHPDGAPAYGNEFITEGYIYPFGTLSATNGVNADGSPEFPDKVIGRWVCRGWHTGEGAKTQTGPWVVTHQVYDLGSRRGQALLTTDGFELVDLNEPIMRAISGGTGPFAQARGEARQVMIGFNQLNGVNLRYEIRVVNRN